MNYLEFKFTIAFIHLMFRFKTIQNTLVYPTKITKFTPFNHKSNVSD